MMLKFTNNTIFPPMPLVMGILNITPDSFYDGGNISSVKEAVSKVNKMLNDGATIIDIGGCSTRPGATEISVETELQRVIPVIEKIRKEFPDIIISVDTYRAIVASQAIEKGANIINDISGGNIEPEIYNVAAKHNVPYVLTHIKGIPQNMQDEPQYENVCEEVFSFFKEKIIVLIQQGVKQIILDPGFGFGKTVTHNYELLQGIKKIKTLGFPVLAGISRKSMINKVINTTPENALNGTSVANTIALLNGADILRVHDIKEAMEAIKIVSFYLNTQNK